MTRRRDPLADHYGHPVTVKRHIGVGANGDKYAAATVESAAIDDTARLVRTSTGAEQLSSTTLALPVDTVEVPLGSLVTLPPSHGGRTGLVLATQRAHGGPRLPTPNHYVLNLE